jgi:ParB-like chromosome segregation protein Spo0J
VIHEHTPPVGVRWHEYADIFPWIEGPAFRELVEDIRKNGVLEPIVFLDGAILDGRNRYMAARELGIEYPRVEYEGDDPLGFVISHNLKRRHLTESQRAMVAARLAKMPQGARNDIAQIQAMSQPRAAEMLNVSRASVQTAKHVQEQGAPELIKAVEAGKVSVSAAAVIAKQDQDTQRRLVAEDKLKRAAADLKKAEAEAKEAEKLPKAEPLTAEQRAEQARIFGTQDDRAVSALIDEVVEKINTQPAAEDAARRIPPALRHSVDTTAIRTAAAWLINFCEIWEKEHAHGLEAAE